MEAVRAPPVRPSNTISWGTDLRPDRRRATKVLTRARALRGGGGGGSRRGGFVRGRTGGLPALAGGRNPQPARRAARRRRERGHRRARARRRRLGLRVRPAARLRGRAGGGREGDRVREGGARRAPAGARAGRACAGRVPDARREGSVRDLARRQGRAVPPGRTCTGARGREGDDGLRACPAGAQGIRLLRGRLDRAGARRVRRRDRRLRHARGHHPDPKPPERTRGLELAGRLGVRRVARARARGATRRRAGGRAAARGPLPVRRDDGRDRRRADAAADARVGRPPDRARPRLRHRGRLRGHELPQDRRISARFATARST